MSTITKKPKALRGKTAKAANVEPPVRLNTDAEVQAYLAAHLKPVRYGPKGQPIYKYEDIAKLNAIFYPDA